MQKRVLITGASGNLGKAVVKKILAEGYKIIAIVPEGESLGYEVNGELELYEANLVNEDATNRVIEEIISKNKNIDAALLLVGGYAYGGLSVTDGSLLKKMFTLNFDTAYFVAKPVFQHMLKQQNGGRIIFVGSKPTLNPQEGRNSLAYALSKSLLFKLSEYLNAEGAAKNVVASVIAPSILDTAQNRKDMPNADFGKWVKVEEVAEIIAFICSEKGSSLRETVLKVYGGA